MRARSVVASTFGIVFVFGSAACESVPDLRFVDPPPDAGDTILPSADASALAPLDAGKDAAANGCPLPMPAGGTCCGRSWCVGQCDVDNCSACEQAACGSGEICCGKPQNVQCKDKCPP